MMKKKAPSREFARKGCPMRGFQLFVNLLIRRNL
jgi:hypothetical protein